MLEALIPFLQPPEYTLAENLPLLGTLKLQVFGPLVAVGVILGMQRCIKFANARDIDEQYARDVMFWSLVSGFVISHWVSVIFYFPERVMQDPIVLLQIWNGLSSVGGLFGFMVGVFWFLHKKKQPFLIYVDMLCFGMLVGFTTGRLGCSLVHDHPGLILQDLSHPLSFLAVHGWKGNPDIVRWDLGTLEFLYLVPMVLFMHFVYPWRKADPGRFVGVAALLYGPFRFFLDFFRISDKQYFGLTPAQYFTFAIMGIGVYFTFIRKPKPSDFEWAKESEYKAERARREAEAAAAAGDDEAKDADKDKPVRDDASAAAKLDA
ncbi:MAG: prolipoprotein diacylglyceryl transferase [Myxococcales bacterium]|nr:prolipoprotein diacylglyceryl transferase [Myxococcales bacterium]